MQYILRLERGPGGCYPYNLALGGEKLKGCSFAVVLCCRFWCQSFGDVSLYLCSTHFSSVLVAEWPPFEK